MTSTAPQWEPVDDATGSLLDLLAEDWRPFAEDDRDLIANAIRDAAIAHPFRMVSPNLVRAALDGRVKPQRVGPVYRALCLMGYLVPCGWETSDDRHGRNTGRPARLYEWVGDL
jgi:hypothetical protein